MEVVRIDKWLWAARFYKTRSAATDAVLGGRVHLNDARVKPSKEVKAGDVVEVKVGQLQWTVVVRGISAKRGSASVAATLYDETPESAAAARAACRPSCGCRVRIGADLAGGRPTKQDRRRIESLRRAQRGGPTDVRLGAQRVFTNRCTAVSSSAVFSSAAASSPEAIASRTQWVT